VPLSIKAITDLFIDIYAAEKLENMAENTHKRIAFCSFKRVEHFLTNFDLACLDHHKVGQKPTCLCGFLGENSYQIPTHL